MATDRHGVGHGLLFSLKRDEGNWLLDELGVFYRRIRRTSLGDLPVFLASLRKLFNVRG
jgi:hypothetical protein